MAESSTPPNPDKGKSLGAIPKQLSNIPIKMDVTVASAKRKARKSSGDRCTPPASPTATKRKVVLVPPSDLPSVISSGGSVVNSKIGSENVVAAVASSPLPRIRAYPSDSTGRSMFSSGPKANH